MSGPIRLTTKQRAQLREMTQQPCVLPNASAAANSLVRKGLATKQVIGRMGPRVRLTPRTEGQQIFALFVLTSAGHALATGAKLCPATGHASVRYVEVHAENATPEVMAGIAKLIGMKGGAQ